ncbi:MAG: hypothetical protein K0U47_02955 [Epsilonproteobacteria bacterium]|nr:hypothetical protein [Campylobacterota bacterium]
MKKILILADGKTAERFLQRLISSDASNNKYHVVYYNDRTLPETKIEKFTYYKFDPSSLTKLTVLLESEEFYQCMIILTNRMDTEASYKNIRSIDEKMQIVLVDKWNLEFNDPNTAIIDAHDTVSNIFSNYLPDLPLFAQNLGIGTGEIMEFKIPFGSPYVYRHIRNIDQKRWRISAIFREHKLLLPTPSTILLPNDNILAVGNPHVLKGVYKSVKREFGQFPIPFGENIYCYIDMKVMDEEEIEMLTNDAMILHSKLNSSKLIFKIINSKFSKVLDKIKSYAGTSMLVEFDFYHDDCQEIIVKDIDRHYIGVVITTQDFLNDHFEFFYHLKLPIFKIGKKGFFHIKESVFLSSDSTKAEKVSSIIFDISSQIKLDIALYDVYLEKSEENEKIISHFQNLAKLFEEKVKVVKTTENPILELNKRDDFLQFVIFEKRFLKSKFISYFSTDLETHYFRLSNNYQLFIPSES